MAVLKDLVAPVVLVVEKDPAEVADLGEAEQEDLQVAAVVDLAAVVVIAPNDLDVQTDFVPFAYHIRNAGDR